MRMSAPGPEMSIRAVVIFLMEEHGACPIFMPYLSFNARIRTSPAWSPKMLAACVRAFSRAAQ